MDSGNFRNKELHQNFFTYILISLLSIIKIKHTKLCVRHLSMNHNF